MPKIFFKNNALLYRNAGGFASVNTERHKIGGFTDGFVEGNLMQGVGSENGSKQITGARTGMSGTGDGIQASVMRLSSINIIGKAIAVLQTGDYHVAGAEQGELFTEFLQFRRCPAGVFVCAVGQ